MQIFYTDFDARNAARSLVDQHVNKQVAETAQILSNCYTLDEMRVADCPRTTTGTPRRHSYPHHPCCKWAQINLQNFYWLIAHGRYLEDERLYRGFNPHYSYRFIEWCAWNPPQQPNEPMTKPPQAFGKWGYLIDPVDPVAGYRRYYNIAKWQQETLKKVWTNRKPPEWWEHNVESTELPDGRRVYRSDA